MTKEEEVFIDALYDYFGYEGINALNKNVNVYLNVTKTCNTGEICHFQNQLDETDKNRI